MEYSGWGKFALPLGISFFTFQQIAYSGGRLQRPVCEKDPRSMPSMCSFSRILSRGLWCFMPTLFHNSKIRLGKDCSSTMGGGLFLFSIGLFKKVVLADHLGPYVSVGFGASGNLGFFDAWLTSIMYALQSPTTSAAIVTWRSARPRCSTFNCRRISSLHICAQNIQDFWRRWHITLSKFLRDYLYIPLGGSQCALEDFLQLDDYLFAGGSMARWLDIFVLGISSCMPVSSSFESIPRCRSACRACSPGSSRFNL